MTPTEVVSFTFEKQPVYHQADYLKMLKKNNESLGIPYIEPNLPEATPYIKPEKSNEPRLEYGDSVGVNLKILKNGTVRVKVSTAIANMYAKYYRRAVQPPFSVVLQAYKAHGFSPQFLEKIKKSHEKKMAFAKKLPKIYEKIFEKEPVKKVKKKEEVVDEDEPLKSDEPIEDETLDVEPDEDEEVVEEEYISDGEDT